MSKIKHKIKTKDIYLIKSYRELKTVIDNLTQEMINENRRKGIETCIILDLNIIVEIRKFIFNEIEDEIKRLENIKFIQSLRNLLLSFTDIHISPGFALDEANPKYCTKNLEAFEIFTTYHLNYSDSYNSIPFTSKNEDLNEYIDCRRTIKSYSYSLLLIQYINLYFKNNPQELDFKVDQYLKDYKNSKLIQFLHSDNIIESSIDYIIKNNNGLISLEESRGKIFELIKQNQIERGFNPTSFIFGNLLKKLSRNELKSFILYEYYLTHLIENNLIKGSQENLIALYYFYYHFHKDECDDSIKIIAENYIKKSNKFEQILKNCNNAAYDISYYRFSAFMSSPHKPKGVYNKTSNWFLTADSGINELSKIGFYDEDKPGMFAINYANNFGQTNYAEIHDFLSKILMQDYSCKFYNKDDYYEHLNSQTEKLCNNIKRELESKLQKTNY